MVLLIAIVLAVGWLPHPWGIVAVVIGAVVEVGEIWLWLRWSRRRRPRVGLETMVGRTATVVIPCRPLGQVRIDGEIWAARCAEGADTGEQVEVIAAEADGLTLDVVPVRR